MKCINLAINNSIKLFTKCTIIRDRENSPRSSLRTSSISPFSDIFYISIEEIKNKEWKLQGKCIGGMELESPICFCCCCCCCCHRTAGLHQGRFYQESNSALTHNGVLPGRACSTIVYSKSPYARIRFKMIRRLSINLRHKKARLPVLSLKLVKRFLRSLTLGVGDVPKPSTKANIQSTKGPVEDRAFCWLDICFCWGFRDITHP